MIAHEVARDVARLAAALSAAGCVYLIACCVLVRRFRRNAPAIAQAGAFEPVGVSVLVPLYGAEPGLAGRLERLRSQAYSGEVQIVCGVLDGADPACADVEKAAAPPAGRPLELCVDARIHGRNLKISNLINMTGRARHDIFVMVDSDMEVAPDYLSRVVGTLQRPGTGAVTCLYRGRAVGGTPSKLAALGIDTHFLPDAVFGMATGMAHPCFGATIAIGRTDLAEIGGLPALADRLWDDYAIGRAVRLRGKAVRVCEFTPLHACVETSLRALFSGQLRAARTLRGIDPLGHAGTIVTHPFALALLACVASGALWAWLLAAISLLCRLVLALCVVKRFGGQKPPLALVPVHELLAFVTYVASYGGRTVEWRGRRYRVTSDGTLTPTVN